MSASHVATSLLGVRRAAHARTVVGARAWAWLLFGGWVTQVLLRIWIARPARVPTANPDEIGYLAAARLIAGRGTGGLDLSHQTFYQGGYPLLISPVWWFTDHASTVYRVVQVENAAIGALLVPLAYVVGRRLGLPRAAAFATAYLADLVPGAVFFDAYALTDAVLPVIVLAWLICVHVWLTDGGRRRVVAAGAAASVAAGWSTAVHTRGILIAAAHGVLILVVLLRRWRSGRQIALVTALFAGTIAGGWLLNNFVENQLYPDGVRNLGGLAWDRLTSGDGWGWTWRIGTGELWAQLVGTAGLAGAGLIVCARGVFDRRRTAADRTLGSLVVVLFAAIALAAAAASPDEERVGNDAYGRYLACLAPFLVAVAVAALLTCGVASALRLAAAVVLLVVCSAIVVRYTAGHDLRADTFLAFDFPDICGLTWDWDRLRLFRASAVALAGFAVVVAASRAAHQVRAAAVLGTAGLLFLVVLGGARWNIVGPPARTVAALTDEHAEVSRLRTVAADLRIYWPVPLILDYERRWPNLTMFDPAYQAPPPNTDLVFVAWDGQTPPEATWPAGLAPDNYRVVAKRWVADFEAPWPPHLQGWVAWRRKI